MKIRNWLSGLVPAVLLFAICGTAQAGTYYWRYTGAYYSGTLTHAGVSKTYENGTFNNAGPFGYVLAADQAIFKAVKDDVNTEIGKVAPTLVAGAGYDTTLQNYSTSVDGKMNIDISPRGSISVSGMVIHTHLQTHSSKYVSGVKVGVVCDIYVDYPNAVATGGFDLSNGLMGVLTVTPGTYSDHYYCSTDIDVPFITGIANDCANKIAGSGIAEGLAKLQSFTLYLPTGASDAAGYAGLAKGMPTGQYIINGVDYGKYVSQNLVTLISQGGVSSKFTVPVAPPDSPASPAYADDVRYIPVPAVIVTFGLADIQFEFDVTQVQKVIWVCSSGPTAPRNSCGSEP